MEDFKGTKGEWTIGPQYELDNGNEAMPIECNDLEVCVLTAGLGFDLEELANARLIAAAPELLAAAQFAVKMIYENSLDNQLPKTLSELENAIAKALSH